MKNIFKLNNVKFFAAAIAICGASLLGYNAYSNATMTDQERLFQQNLDALTSDEDGPITHSFCYSGDEGTSVEGYKCADGTITTITTPGIPMGATYPCPANTANFSLLSKMGYCYKSI